MKGVEERLLRETEKALWASSSLILWIPTQPNRDKTDRRWGAVWNDG
jgi:hypothetical protein